MNLIKSTAGVVATFILAIATTSLVLSGSFYVADILRAHSELHRMDLICKEFPAHYICQ